MTQISKYKRSGGANTYLPPTTFYPVGVGREGGSDSKLVGLLDSSPYPLHIKRGDTLLDKISNRFAISCKESRIETNTSFYGCFYLGPFDQGESVTIANALRRTLLSDLMGVAITSVEIEGAVHEYTSITGVRESVLDILLNLKEIILKQTTLSSSVTFTPQGQTMPLATSHSIIPPPLLTNPPIKASHKGVVLSKSKVNYLERKKKGWGNQIGYLRARGPGVIRASDLKLPPYIVCVDPEQYIATLSDDGVLNMKFFISEGKNYLIQVPNKNVDLNELKRQRLFQKKMKQHAMLKHEHTVAELGMSNSFVRYAPFKITSDLLPLRPPITYGCGASMVGRPDSTISNSKGLVGGMRTVVACSGTEGRRRQQPQRGSMNLSGSDKQKKVFNEASNGNRLPIDAVFMPVTKVNYIIEPDEQSNDEQFNDDPNNNKRDSNYISKALYEESGGITSIETNSPSLPFRFLPLTPKMLIAEFQNLGLQRRSEEEQRAFSNLLVNPLLKTQTPSLFLKHPFNGDTKMLTPFLGSALALGSKTALLPGFAKVDIPETHNRKGLPTVGYSKEQSQGARASFLTTPTYGNVGNAMLPTVEGLKKISLRQKKGSSDVSFTFLHPAPFLSLQDKQRMNENLKNGSCEDKSKEEGQQAIFKNKKQQELLFLGESLPLPTYGNAMHASGHDLPSVAKEQVVGQEVFTKKDPLKFKIILEIWTNGSIHPRKALYDSFKSMITLFSRLQKVQILGSMLKSERFYNKLIEQKFNTKKVPLAPQPPLTSKKNLTPSCLASALPATPTLLSLPHALHTGGLLRKGSRVKAFSLSKDTEKVKGLKGLYSLKKTVTGLQTYLPAAATLLVPTTTAVVGTSKGSILPTEQEWLGENFGESGSEKLHLLTIESLNLSLRSYTCLKRSNIHTINDLMGHSKKQLIQIKNFGVHSLEEIQTRLGVFGFKLR